MKSSIVKPKAVLQTLEEEKNELAIKVLSLKDQQIVHEINNLINELVPARVKRTSIKQYNKEIEEAEKRINEGKFTKHEDVVIGLKKLLNGKK